MGWWDDVLSLQAFIWLLTNSKASR